MGVANADVEFDPIARDAQFGDHGFGDARGGHGREIKCKTHGCLLLGFDFQSDRTIVPLVGGANALPPCRSFESSVETSPYPYLMQQRVKCAKQLLLPRSLAKPPGTGIAISSIALDCGFANQTHLTKVFRQITGMTPKAYQKRAEYMETCALRSQLFQVRSSRCVISNMRL
jgi:AraC-like DNA-binding protein